MVLKYNFPLKQQHLWAEISEENKELHSNSGKGQNLFLLLSSREKKYIQEDVYAFLSYIHWSNRRCCPFPGMLCHWSCSQTKFLQFPRNEHLGGHAGYSIWLSILSTIYWWKWNYRENMHLAWFDPKNSWRAHTWAVTQPMQLFLTTTLC